MSSEAMLVLMAIIGVFLAFGFGLYYADRQTRQFRD
jgi:hypothetical protein